MSYDVEIWRWEEKQELEKIMFDYIRWVFKLDFCTLRYLMTRELGIEKLKIRLSTRTRRFEERIKGTSEDKWLKKC